MDWLIHFDMDNDGDQDAVDQQRVSQLSTAYLQFNWR
jgi:hypothetical protein